MSDLPYTSAPNFRVPRYYPAPGTVGPNGRYIGVESPAVTAWARANAHWWRATDRIHEKLDRLRPPGDQRPIPLSEFSDVFEEFRAASLTQQLSRPGDSGALTNAINAVCANLDGVLDLLHEEWGSDDLSRERVEFDIADLQRQFMDECVDRVIETANDPDRMPHLDHMAGVNIERSVVGSDMSAKQKYNLALLVITHEAVPPAGGGPGLRPPSDDIEFETRNIRPNVMDIDMRTWTPLTADFEPPTFENYAAMYRYLQQARVDAEAQLTIGESLEDRQLLEAELEDLARAQIATTELQRRLNGLIYDRDTRGDKTKQTQGIDDLIGELDAAWAESVARDERQPSRDPRSHVPVPSMLTVTLGSLRDKYHETRETLPALVAFMSRTVEEKTAQRQHALWIAERLEILDLPGSTVLTHTEDSTSVWPPPAWTQMRERVQARLDGILSRQQNRYITAGAADPSKPMPLIIFDDPEPPEPSIGARPRDPSPGGTPGDSTEPSSVESPADLTAYGEQRRRKPGASIPPDSLDNASIGPTRPTDTEHSRSGPPRAPVQPFHGNGSDSTRHTDWRKGFGGPDDLGGLGRRFERDRPRRPGPSDRPGPGD